MTLAIEWDIKHKHLIFTHTHTHTHARTHTHMSHIMRKPTFCIYAKTKTQISFTVTANLISAFGFATLIALFLYFLNPKFPAYGHLLCLCSSVCVRHVRKPHCWFSHYPAHVSILVMKMNLLHQNYQKKPRRRLRSNYSRMGTRLTLNLKTRTLT